MRLERMWSFLDTSTTTSASPRRTQRGRRTQSGASESSWWAPGGKSHYPIVNPIANSEVHNDETYGVLKLTLHPHSYEWQFVPVEGESFTDSGDARCH